MKLLASKNSRIIFCILLGIILTGFIYRIGVDKRTMPLDNYISNYMDEHSDPEIRAAFFKITVLGAHNLVLALTILSTIVLFYLNKRIEAILLCAGIGAIGITVYILKTITKRPGPWGNREIEYSWLFPKGDWAFPSGHTCLATFFYVFLAYIVACNTKTKFWTNIYYFSILMSIFIGFTRIYLNVHWTSDVIGAFMLSWIYLCIFISIYQSRTGKKLN